MGCTQRISRVSRHPSRTHMFMRPQEKVKGNKSNRTSGIQASVGTIVANISLAKTSQMADSRLRVGKRDEVTWQMVGVESWGPNAIAPP